MAEIPTFTDSQLRAICKAIGHTEEGLTGPEIEEVLHSLNIADIEGKITKWKRLYGALHHRQQQDGCGNLVVAFIQKAMDPVRWLEKSGLFEHRRADLNSALAFCKLFLREDGRLKRVEGVTTLTEAQERAGRLRAELTRISHQPPQCMVFGPETPLEV